VLAKDKARLVVDAEAMGRKHDVLGKEVTLLERSLRYVLTWVSACSSEEVGYADAMWACQGIC
jgi:hypothetical protein